MQTQSTNPQLYRGVITKSVNLLSLKPCFMLPTSQIIENITSQGRIHALKTRKSLSYLGSQYSQLLTPCIPAFQHAYYPPNDQVDRFSHYYIKTKQQSNIRAIQSGKRSVILEIEQNNCRKLLRYKGCGNQLKGFVIEKSYGYDDVRGSHFFETSKRQLYMTQLINQLMKKQLNISPPANKPICLYEYPSEFLKSMQISNQLPKVGKYCCVFETQGDRRAGTHLISPLQIIFLSLFDQANPESLQQLFNDRNRYDQGELVEFITNFELFVPPGSTFHETYQQTQQLKNYITLKDGEFTMQKHKQEIIKKIIDRFVVPQYHKKCHQIFDSISNLLKVVKIIIDRIGWQMGQIKRVMSKNGISWGFFQDHGKLFHSNAHLNNFIVTRPQSSTQSTNYFILPLDYDLAYHKKQFLNIEQEAESYGEFDSDVFQGYQCAQYNAMEMSLFGLEIMDFKYGIQSDESNPADSKQSNKKKNRIIFRDSIVKSFIQGMRNNYGFHEQLIKLWDDNIEDISKLVECCLMISLDFQT